MTEKSSTDVVLSVMRDGVIRSDAEIESASGLSHGKVSGARVALWKQGLLERVDRDAQRHWRFQLCPDERRAAAHQAYRDHVEARERSRLAAKSVGERASLAAFLLSDDAVNEAVLAQIDRSKTWRRAQGRANDVRAETEAIKRARRREIDKATGAHLAFLTALDRLRAGIDVLLSLRHQLEDAQRRATEDLSPTIPPARWPALAKNVRETLEVAQILYRDLGDAMGEPVDSCPLCGERLMHVTHALDEGYVDADVVEEVST
jgi:hypothetical protein